MTDELRKAIRDVKRAANAALLAENEQQARELAGFKLWARSIAYRTDGATSAVERAINIEAHVRAE